jgi:molybdopterin-guanine dinucleotide biosynthesis protein B
LSERSPPVVCIIGRKNSGKTELTVALAAELKRRGRRVMTAKHGHGFRVDQAGKDSWRHRHEGGAVRTVMAGPRDFAVIGGWPGEEMSLVELIRRFLWDADLVLAEGFKGSPEPKIEVHRVGVHPRPLLLEDESRRARTMALVTDAIGLEVDLPVFEPGDPGHVIGLADLLEERFLSGGSGGMVTGPFQVGGGGGP